MPEDSTQVEKENLVNQILEIWDKLYDTVLESLAEKPKVALPQGWGTSGFNLNSGFFLGWKILYLLQQ